VFFIRLGAGKKERRHKATRRETTERAARKPFILERVRGRGGGGMRGYAGGRRQIKY